MNVILKAKFKPSLKINAQQNFYIKDPRVKFAFNFEWKNCAEISWIFLLRRKEEFLKIHKF